jgi:hypothetical protein
VPAKKVWQEFGKNGPNHITNFCQLNLAISSISKVLNMWNRATDSVVILIIFIGLKFEVFDSRMSKLNAFGCSKPLDSVS